MELLRSALDLGADPNAWVLKTDWYPDGDETALLVAVEGGHLEAVRALLKAGADSELRSGADKNNKLTPLIIAVERSAPIRLYGERDFLGLDHARDAVERLLLPIVVALIESGANVEASYHAEDDDFGTSKSLRCAVKYGRRRTLLTLLRAGASPEATEHFEVTYTGDESFPFSCHRKDRGDAKLLVRGFGEKLEIVSIDGKPITAEFSNDDLDAFLVNRQSAAQAGAHRPYRVGYFRRMRSYSPAREPFGSNDSTLALMEAIQNAGSFDEYARRMQRDVHVAILSKCFQEKLPLEIKTILTTYLWKWGGA